MTKKFFYLHFFLISILPTVSFSFFCPTNFKQIEMGMTPEQVTQQCGKPNKQTSATVQPEGPQEWSYYIPQTVSNTGFNPMKGTLKTQITFDAEGKAINITVNGIGVGASTICGSQIQLGDTRDSIKNVCGTPSFINRQNGNPNALGNAPAPNQITEFTYTSTGNPTLVLKFVNGRLESKH